MNLVDIHAHLNFPQYDTDREEVIKRTVAAGCGVINVGTDLPTSREVIELAEQYPDFYATVGFHPDECQSATADLTLESWGELESLAKHERVVAIGECGLDFGRNPKLEAPNPKQISKQKEIFAKQVELALKVKKPLMIHCRNAYQELLDFLTWDLDIGNLNLKANAHFFAGNLEQAKQFLDLGFTLSFTGVITFTHDYDEVIKFAPLDRIMAETDAPFVAPAPYRGKRNEPLYVREVVKRLAELKGVSEKVMTVQTLATAASFCYDGRHVRGG